MEARILSMLVVGLLGSGLGTAYSDDSMAEKKANPTITERVTRDTIMGTLTRKEGEYYYIRDDDGQVQKIHVDKSTKLDKVMTGDFVKAYVTDQGHTTTLQRDD